MRRLADRLVVGGGMVFPFFLISGSLLSALSIMAGQTDEGEVVLVMAAGE
ncbi:hypothetical protein [Hoeflea sp. BAL378]|nr:hypothetical protein [Hoeflea sp. BAL378]